MPVTAKCVTLKKHVHADGQRTTRPDAADLESAGIQTKGESISFAAIVVFFVSPEMICKAQCVTHMSVMALRPVARRILLKQLAVVFGAGTQGVGQAAACLSKPFCNKGLRLCLQLVWINLTRESEQHFIQTKLPPKLLGPLFELQAVLAV